MFGTSITRLLYPRPGDRVLLSSNLNGQKDIIRRHWDLTKNQPSAMHNTVGPHQKSTEDVTMPKPDALPCPRQDFSSGIGKVSTMSKGIHVSFRSPPSVEAFIPNKALNNKLRYQTNNSIAIDSISAHNLPST